MFIGVPAGIVVVVVVALADATNKKRNTAQKRKILARIYAPVKVPITERINSIISLPYLYPKKTIMKA